MSVTHHRASPNGKGVKKIHAVEESSHAVDESSPAVGSFFHGFLFFTGRRPAFTARRPAENRCYVKKFTNDVIFFTYYVTFFT